MDSYLSLLRVTLFCYHLCSRQRVRCSVIQLESVLIMIIGKLEQWVILKGQSPFHSPAFY